MGLNQQNVGKSRNPLESPCEVSVQLSQLHSAQVFKFVCMLSSANLAQGVGRSCHSESPGTLDRLTSCPVFSKSPQPDLKTTGTDD